MSARAVWALALLLVAGCGGAVEDLATEPAPADAGADCAQSWSFSWPTYFPGETAPSFDGPVGDAGVVERCVMEGDSGPLYLCAPLYP